MTNKPPSVARQFPGESIRELLKWPGNEAHDRIAVIFDGQHLSYGALDDQSLEIAEGLKAKGVSRGGCVSTFLPNSLEIYQLYFAAGHLGAIFLPINVALSAPEVGYLIQHARPQLIFTTAGLRATVDQAVAVAGYVPVVIEVDGSAVSGERLRHIAVPGARPEPQFEPTDIAIISYTSGTTANPKAMAYDHRVEVNGCALYRDAWDLRPSDKVLVSMSMGWTYGINPGSFPAFRGGATILLLEKFNPVRVLEAIEANKVTVMMGVPTMYGMMLDHVAHSGKKYDLSSLRLVLCAGSELPSAIETRFAEIFGIRLTNFLSMGEVKLVASPRVAENEVVPQGSVGKPPPGVQVRLVDEDGEDVANGDVGEILVKSPGWMTGYYREPEKTAAVVRDGWYVSGDLGRFDAAGYLYVTGRTREQIIRGGAKVAPAEVEDVLSSHPDVQLTAVIGVPDTLYGEQVKAIVISRNPSLTAEQLQAFCKGKMAPFKIPTSIAFVADLPIGPTGKVMKKILRAQSTQ